MRVPVVDIVGTKAKILATGQKTPRKFPSGKTMTPDDVVLACAFIGGFRLWKKVS